MIAPLLSLESPRSLPRRVRAGQIVAAIAFLVLIILGAAAASVALDPVPATGMLHAVMGAFVSGLTALLMYEHAEATGKRGFLVISMTFLYLAGVLLVFPLAFPSGIIDGETLMGSVQTPVGLFFAWHFAVPVGLTAACVLLYTDESRHRRPSLTPAQMRGAVGICVALAILTVFAAVVCRSQAPTS